MKYYNFLKNEDTEELSVSISGTSLKTISHWQENARTLMKFFYLYAIDINVKLSSLHM